MFSNALKKSFLKMLMTVPMMVFLKFCLNVPLLSVAGKNSLLSKEHIFSPLHMPTQPTRCVFKPVPGSDIASVLLFSSKTPPTFYFFRGFSVNCKIVVLASRQTLTLGFRRGRRAFA